MLSPAFAFISPLRYEDIGFIGANDKLGFVFLNFNSNFITPCLFKYLTDECMNQSKLLKILSFISIIGNFYFIIGYLLVYNNINSLKENPLISEYAISEASSPSKISIFFLITIIICQISLMYYKKYLFVVLLFIFIIPLVYHLI